MKARLEDAATNMDPDDSASHEHVRGTPRALCERATGGTTDHLPNSQLKMLHRCAPLHIFLGLFGEAMTLAVSVSAASQHMTELPDFH